MSRTGFPQTYVSGRLGLVIYGACAGKAASALNHPNIIQIYDISSSDGTDYIAMEFVDGKTLDQLIWQERPAAEGDAEIFDSSIERRRIEGESASGDDTVDMRMKLEFLVPRGAR